MSDTFQRNGTSQLRLLVDLVPSMLAYWDRDLRCQFANRAYERWFGVDPAHLVGSTLPDLLGPVLFAANEPHIQAVLRGEQQAFERVLIGPDGVRRHSLATYVPDMVGDVVVGFIAHVVEVTPLKDVEAALRSEVAQRAHANDLLQQRESELRQAQRLGRIGSWAWDAERDTTVWSEALYEIFGLDPTQPSPTLAQHPALYEAQSLARLQEKITRALALGEPYTLELAYRRSDGQSGWLEARGEPVRDAHGVVRGLRGTCQEVSMRRQAEDDRVRLGVLEQTMAAQTAAAQEVDRMRLLMAESERIAGLGSWEYATATEQTVWSEGEYQIFGLDPAAPSPGYQQMLRDHIHPDDVAQLDRAFRDALAQGAPFETENRIRKPDGLTRDVLNRARPFFDQAGQIVKYAGFTLDITERKAAEAQLRRAKEDAEAANVAKSAFLANMSHELRTPLNAITGMTHLLKRSGVTPEQVDRLDKIHRAGQHLLGTIDNILELSRIEAGKLTLTDEAVDLPRVCAAVVTMVAEQARGKGLRLAVDAQPPVPNLRGDPIRLQQALLNLASNAVKFTQQGRVLVSARVDDENAHSVRVRFEVQDTGIGIGAAEIPRLFGAFEQVDGSMARAYGGSGLGLAITRKLAQLMGGDAGVRSTVGVGSAFWFTAWLKKGAPAGHHAAPSAANAAEATLLRDHRGRRVLLAEDEPLNREIGQALLAQAGLTTVVAADGLEALALAEGSHFDLVLMDIQMPRLNGIDTTLGLRQMPGFATVPIVALTANVFVEDVAKCLNAGMNDFITKPIEPEKLFATVLQWLTAASAKGAAGSG